MKKIIRYFKRFVHPHLMAVVTPKELFTMSDEDFAIIS